jgi:hypothetical protein
MIEIQSKLPVIIPAQDFSEIRVLHQNILVYSLL